MHCVSVNGVRLICMHAAHDMLAGRPYAVVSLPALDATQTGGYRRAVVGYRIWQHVCHLEARAQMAASPRASKAH